MNDPIASTKIERPQTIADQTQDHLRQMIINGTLPANTPLSEYDLARRLEISRSPLREAIHQLQDEGLLDASGPRGFTVPPINKKFVMALYEVRETLETRAAATATPPPKPELLAAEQTLAAARKALDRGDGTAFTASDLAFHNLYVGHCDNPLLQRMLERIHGHVQRVHHFANPLLDHIEASYQEHLTMLESIKAEDPKALVAATHAHIGGVRNRLVAYIPE